MSANKILCALLFLCIGGIAWLTALHLQARAEINSLVASVNHHQDREKNLQHEFDSEERLLRHVHRRLRDANRRAVRYTSDIVASLDTEIQDELDAEEMIEVHNRVYPDLPLHDLKELLVQMCGDCGPQRAYRAAILAQNPN